MKIKDLWHKIKRRWIKLRLQPIRVFCFHQVSETFDASTMWECDWTQMDQFKLNILHLKEQYEFISLIEATEKLKHDVFRTKKYAVLTADDGWASLKNIIPWIVEQGIPITLFVNPAYLLGNEIRENGMSQLLFADDLITLCNNGKPYLSIASHGWNHQLAIDQSFHSFQLNVEKSRQYLLRFECYKPYFAYPCGKHFGKQDIYLKENALIPVYCDGQKNYNNGNVIHREPIDGCRL